MPFQRESSWIITSRQYRKSTTATVWQDSRKNWLFSDSVEGTQASAIAYTMVEMAKAHNLKIYSYLRYVLEQRPDETWSDEQLAKLAPWSEKNQTLKI